MNVCQSCGAERGDLDRFCRSCGVSISPSVADLEDTRRFNPAAPATVPGTPSGFTSQFYVPPAAAYPVSQAESSVYKTSSLRKKLLKQKAFWIFTLVLISMFTMIGVGIGMKVNNSRRVAVENRARRISTEDVPNAFGLRTGAISEAGYAPEIKGIFVESLVTDDGPAALANIQAGDVILQIGDKLVRNNSEIRDVLNTLSVGAVAPIKVYREGETLTLQIKIADRNFPPLQPKLEMREQGWLGVDNSTRRCGIPGVQKCGVEIENLDENSPADLGGLREGDVITEFNGYKVRTPDEFNRRIRMTKPRTKVTVTYYHGNAEQKTELILGYRR
ncbi:MAG: PDZ domain-containing protein [Acidobacteria bacterium]|nr:PDZ domain-containing protein [Acidobacteriota bacterium]